MSKSNLLLCDLEFLFKGYSKVQVLDIDTQYSTDLKITKIEYHRTFRIQTSSITAMKKNKTNENAKRCVITL